MGMEQLDYTMVLADMEAKRAALDAAIASLKVFMAGQGVTVGSSTTSASMPAGEIPAGAFLGKSIPDAATLYLKIMKRKSTTRDIADGLRKGGMESTSSNFYGIVHAILDRYRKSGGEIVKLDKATWGLAEWYPTGVRNTVQEKPKRKPKKAKAKAKAQEAAKTSSEKPAVQGEQTETLDARIEKILAAEKAKVFTCGELATALNAASGSVNFALGRLARKHKAEKAGAGYRAPTGNVQQMPLAG